MDASLDFDHIYREHFPMVFALCLKVAHGNYHDAEDLSQESFLRAWRYLGRFRGDCLVSTWLHTIAVRAALSEIRKRQSRPTVSLEDAVGGDVIPRWDGTNSDREVQIAVPDRRLESVPELLILGDCMRALKPGRRAIVEMRLQGLSYREAGELLGIKEEAAKHRYRRAVEAMRQRARRTN